MHSGCKDSHLYNTQHIFNILHEIIRYILKLIALVFFFTILLVFCVFFFNLYNAKYFLLLSFEILAHFH